MSKEDTPIESVEMLTYVLGKELGHAQTLAAALMSYHTSDPGRSLQESLHARIERISFYSQALVNYINLLEKGNDECTNKQ